MGVGLSQRVVLPADRAVHGQADASSRAAARFGTAGLSADAALVLLFGKNPQKPFARTEQPRVYLNCPESSQSISRCELQTTNPFPQPCGVAQRSDDPVAAHVAVDERADGLSV